MRAPGARLGLAANARVVRALGMRSIRQTRALRFATSGSCDC